MAKLTDKQKKKIIADYVECQNYSTVAKKHGVSWTTVKNIVSADNSSVKKLEQKKEQNTLDMLDYLATRKDKAQNFVDLCLDAMAKPEKLAAAQVNQISTAMGTVIDKFAPVNSVTSDDDRIFRTDSLLIADGFQHIRRDILMRKHTEYVFPGGRGSTKSSFASLMIVELLKNYADVHVLSVRQVADTLKDSVYSQIEWAIHIQGLENEFLFRKSPLEIIYKKTGQKIYFRGADDPVKIKSIKPPFGHVGILWFEELDQLKGVASVRSIEQSAIRGGDTAWIFKTFNTPRTRDNWANKELDISDSKRLVFRSSYKTAMVPHEWLGKTFIERADHLLEVNPTAYEHEYDGIANGTGGMVFENIKGKEITNAQIDTFDRLHNGCDFGWYPDPWAFNRMHYAAAQRTLYIFDEARANKKSNEETAKIIENKIYPRELVICDSAEPKSIGDYRVFGLSARGAIKGPGSVDYSMKWLQSLDAIIIDPVRCPHTYQEFTGYEYERDKDGNVISGYPDKNDHHISAVRYGMEPVWKVRGQ